MLFVHEKPHEVGLVGELVIEGADPHARRLTDLVNARTVAGLSKGGPRGGQQTYALFLRPPLRPPGRSVGQTSHCRLSSVAPQPSCGPLHLEGMQRRRTLPGWPTGSWSRTLFTCSVARSRSSIPTGTSPGPTTRGRLWKAKPISREYRLGRIFSRRTGGITNLSRKRSGTRSRCVRGKGDLLRDRTPRGPGERTLLSHIGRGASRGSCGFGPDPQSRHRRGPGELSTTGRHEDSRRRPVQAAYAARA